LPTATRRDRQATEDVEQKYLSKALGRFNKDLVHKKYFAAIKTVEYTARAYLYDQTVPWGDDDSRLLAVRRHMKFAQKMQEFGAAFDAEALVIESQWPDIIAEAAIRLAGLFELRQYPAQEQLSSRFAFRVAYTPVPVSGDLRVALDVEQLAEMRARIDEDGKAALKATQSGAWERLHSKVAHMADILTRDKTRIHDSLVQNLVDVCDVLPDLNFTDDPRLNKAIALVKKQLVIPAERLREDPAVKENTAAAAKKIADAMSGWMKNDH
jgi:hypothetical protein